METATFVHGSWQTKMLMHWYSKVSILRVLHVYHYGILGMIVLEHSLHGLNLSITHKQAMKLQSWVRSCMHQCVTDLVWVHHGMLLQLSP